MPVRTGYEQVIAHRTSDLFAQSARQPGKVISIDKFGMVVEYENGEQQGFEIGRRYGSAEGQVIAHQVKTDMKPGDIFGKNDILLYNEGFFEKDILNPKNVVWKQGIVVNTVLMEAPITLEDSSAISKRIANLLSTNITKIRTLVLNFDQSAHKLVKVGDRLETEDILCIIEDSVGGGSDLFDDASLDTLRLLSAQTPLAKIKGQVERIEVFYHGDKDDMSDSLRMITDVADRELAKRCRAQGKKIFTGSVDEGFRIEGDPLMLDSLAIRVYLTTSIPAGIGDKGVFGNQMKTVFGEVLENEIRTKSGKVIDAIFGKKSVDDRVVGSVDLIGTTTGLLEVLAERAIAAYNS